jgi:hypothetical protein
MIQKICIISFDNWNYDSLIAEKLIEKGVDAFHIKIGGFKHKNFIQRIGNTLNKIFLGKNPKIKKRQEYILETLKMKGVQDQILVINPQIIELKCLEEIKQYTKKFIAYLYDSVERFPVEHLLNNLFDEIYSFDKANVKQYGFTPISNYNYLDKQVLLKSGDIKNQVLYIASFDKRLQALLELKQKFIDLSISFRMVIVGKRTMLFRLKNSFSKSLKGLELQRKRISQKELQKMYSETNVVLDIVQNEQTGLSFRVFETMAFQKKLITNNKSIKEYDFYNPNNILVIDNENDITDKSFFNTNYESIPNEIYKKYTLDNWVKMVFKI